MNNCGFTCKNLKCTPEFEEVCLARKYYLERITSVKTLELDIDKQQLYADYERLEPVYRNLKDGNWRWNLIRKLNEMYGNIGMGTVSDLMRAEKRKVKKETSDKIIEWINKHKATWYTHNFRGEKVLYKKKYVITKEIHKAFPKAALNQVQEALKGLLYER